VKIQIWKIGLLFTAVLSVLILLSGCRPEPLAPQEGQLYILSPSAKDTITDSSLDIRVYVDNFSLTADQSRPNQRNEGHLIYYMDITPPLTKGKSALTEEGTYVISIEKSHTWTNLEAGPHNFWVQLVNNDNSPTEPPLAVRVPVTVVLK
jgi:hypothetical protein